MSSLIRPALSLFVLLSILTGLIYPLLVTGVAQTLFADQAAGSLVSRNGQIVGSRLIGQNFTDAGHFWSRPSATTPSPYNGSASGGSNLGPLNPALAAAVAAQRDHLTAADPDNPLPIPADLLTTSASGLDPHISPEAAHYQVARIARQRHVAADTLHALVDAHRQDRQWSLFGEPRVNVLELNLALDPQR